MEKNFKLIYPTSFGKCQAHHNSLNAQSRFIRRLPDPTVKVQRFTKVNGIWQEFIIHEGLLFTKDLLLKLLSILQTNYS
jgi:hypothetical protein